jgi:hypothetical protein
MTDFDHGLIVRMATFCGDCKRKFEDSDDAFFYVRQRPARLICEACKNAEPPALTC